MASNLFYWHGKRKISWKIDGVKGTATIPVLVRDSDPLPKAYIQFPSAVGAFVSFHYEMPRTDVIISSGTPSYY